MLINATFPYHNIYNDVVGRNTSSISEKRCSSYYAWKGMETVRTWSKKNCKKGIVVGNQNLLVVRR